MTPLPKVQIVSLDEVPSGWRGGVVAIGNFDGMHRGHQAVLNAARRDAEQRGVASFMLTLEPHPRVFFSGRPLFRLTPPPLKAAATAALGLDGMLVLAFDRERANQSAEDFVRQVLVERLAISAAVTGYDFQFGKARRGTPEFLASEGERLGFTVKTVDALTEGGESVSSTRIRAALANGDVAAGNALLGWHFAIAGTVIQGDKRGRELGYPTANMTLDPATELAVGIYAVRFTTRDGSVHDGVASYGRRPTFGEGPPLLETFVFDFAGDLYGEIALISFYAFIRSEKRFGKVADLVAQMDQDSIDARALLERMPPGELDGRLCRAWAKFHARR